MKCANCDSLALFVYRVTMETVFPYCGKHLPKFLDPMRRAGNLLTTEEHQRLLESVLNPAPKEGPQKPKKKAKKDVENNEDNS